MEELLLDELELDELLLDTSELLLELDSSEELELELDSEELELEELELDWEEVPGSGFSEEEEDVEGGTNCVVADPSGYSGMRCGKQLFT